MLKQIRDTYYGISGDSRLDSLKSCSSQDVLNAAQIVYSFGDTLERHGLKIHAISCLKRVCVDEVSLKQAKDLIELFMEAHKESSEGLAAFIAEMKNH